LLSVPHDVARALSPDIQRMLGYSIHPLSLERSTACTPLRLLESHVADQSVR